VDTTNNLSLMERVALTRLRRFERVAVAAETSGSPVWQKLAQQAARSAYRDTLLAASARGDREAARRLTDDAEAA
jgi:hypothetical protein